MDGTKERKMVSRNVAIALGIICIVLVALIGYFTVTGISAQNSYNNLQNQINQLQAWLDGNITNYETAINSLNSNIASLQNQINSDSTTINSLTSQNSNLQSQYTSLQANYSQLMQEYQVALAEIPSDKGITIDAVNYTAGQDITGVAVRNLGVNATTVVSLKLYWTTEGVLASSASVDVVIAGNSTADIQTFLPINGWNTVYDIWTLKVETLEGYNATSDPLMLIL